MLKSRHQHKILPAGLWLLFSIASLHAQAHEFWIEPVEFQLATGDLLQANVRVGQEMRGDAQYYIPHMFEAFDLTVDGATGAVKSRTGDNPAVSEIVNTNALHILSYVSTDSQLTYSEAGKFEYFLKYEGIQWVKTAHEKRGLPALGFTEAYKRFAKSLIKVGDGRGKDRALGFEFELVLESNPYTDRDPEVVAQLLWLGNPFPHAQINVFRRHAGKVSRTQVTTDAEGRVSIPRHGAPGVYLLNAVHMIEPPPNDSGVVWKSLWASTTFELMD